LESHLLASSIIPVPDCDILKVGHHGSRTASSAAYLSVAKPEVAVYQAGTGNTYGHPHQETLIALDNIGAQIYGTDVHGTVTVTTDGKTYSVQTQKQAPLVKPAIISLAPTPTAIASPTTTPTVTQSGAANVVITRIFYDGLVPSVESDEYVEIANQGSQSVDLRG